jgi:hypothetical protein
MTWTECAGFRTHQNATLKKKVEDRAEPRPWIDEEGDYAL